MNIIEDFDAEKYFLGSLCKRGHKYCNTSKSLRYKAQSNCVECARIRALRLLRENSESELQRRHKYSQENKEKIAQRNANWNKNNKEKITAKRRENYILNRDKILEKVAEYRRKNPEKVKESQRNYYFSNREKRKISHRNWRKKNKEKVKAYRQKYHVTYYLNNREKIKARISIYRKTEAGKASLSKQNSIRYARLRSVHSVSYTNQQLLDRFREFNNSCAYCGATEDLTADHFLAMSEGGSDCLGNIICACRSCNSRKNCSDPLEWYKRQSFYSEDRWTHILKILGKTTANYNQIPLL